MRYVYIGNFGYCWRLTVEEWRAICEAGAEGYGYDLSPFKALRRFPSWLERGEDSDQRYNTRNDRLYYEPLDWTAEDFGSALKELAIAQQDIAATDIGFDEGLGHGSAGSIRGEQRRP